MEVHPASSGEDARRRIAGGWEVSRSYACRTRWPPYAERSGVRCFRRKPCADLVGIDDGDALGRRFPPWRRHCEAPALHPLMCSGRNPRSSILGSDIDEVFDVVAPLAALSLEPLSRGGLFVVSARVRLVCWYVARLLVVVGLFSAGGGGGSDLWRRPFPWSSLCCWSISLLGAHGGGEVSNFGALRRCLRFGCLA